MRTCASCYNNKNESEFHKNGDGYLRKSCKPCTNRTNRASRSLAKVRIPRVAYEDMPEEYRKASYHDVITRMEIQGIMSEKTASEARGRVG